MNDILSQLHGLSEQPEPQPDTGFLSHVLPQGASPYGSLLEPEQLDALRRQALLHFGASLLASQGTPEGRRAGFLPSVGAAIESTNWPGMLGAAGEQAMSLEQQQAKQAGMQAIQEIIRRHSISDDAQTGDKLSKLKAMSQELLALGTPEGMQAAEQVGNLYTKFKETAPAHGSIDWVPQVVDGRKVKVAVDPQTRKYLDDPDKPGQRWTVDEGAEMPKLTEAQRIQYEQNLNTEAVPKLIRYSDTEGRLNDLLEGPIPESDMGRQLWLNQAAQVLGSAKAGSPEDASLFAGLIGLFNEKVAKAMEKGEGISPKVIQDIRNTLVARARKTNREAGQRLWSSYNAYSHRLGFVSEIIEHYRSAWGPGGDPVATSKGADELLNLGGPQ
jgi:hypothetical protein